MELTEFLLARIGEDEAAAQAAIQSDRPGTHWQWVTNDTDTVVAPGELAEAQQHQQVSLRTVEEFPTRSVGPLPGFVISYAEETDPGGGEHIARWDPARVLAEVEAKRRILDWHRLINGVDAWDKPVLGCGNCCACGVEGEFLIAGPCLTIRLLALPYADHEDFQESWRP